MLGHPGIDPPDLPAARLQPRAQFGLLPRQQVGAKPARFFVSRNAIQRVAAAGPRRANRRIPLRVAHCVVHRCRRMRLEPATTNDGGSRVRAKETLGIAQPIGIEQAVPVDELHQLHVRIFGSQRSITGNPTSRGTQQSALRKHHDLDTEAVCDRDASVARRRIGIDDPRRLAEQRHQARFQPGSFVAPDRDDADHRRQSGRSRTFRSQLAWSRLAVMASSERPRNSPAIPHPPRPPDGETWLAQSAPVLRSKTRVVALASIG